jgi:hypothetical protein
MSAICQTIFHGQGGNCTTGGALDNYGSTTFDGYWHAVSHQVCGHTWLSPADANGNLHPDANNYAFFPGSLTVEYTGDCLDYDGSHTGGGGSGGSGGSGGGGINTNQPCDCLNGNCVPAATFKTPGYYPNLSTCEAGCVRGLPCNGECVSAAAIANIEQAVNNLQSRLCG